MSEGVYTVGIVVLVEFRGGDRLVLTTNGTDVVEDTQTPTLFAAYHPESPYTLTRMWEGRYGTFPLPPLEIYTP